MKTFIWPVLDICPSGVVLSMLVTSGIIHFGSISFSFFNMYNSLQIGSFRLADANFGPVSMLFLTWWILEQVGSINLNPKPKCEIPTLMYLQGRLYLTHPDPRSK